MHFHGVFILSDGSISAYPVQHVCCKIMYSKAGATLHVISARQRAG